MVILGINSYHPDASAAIIVDGRLVAACEEERLNRIKHCAGFPGESVRYCLQEAGISAKDIDFIAIPRKTSSRIFRKALYGIKIPSLAKDRLAAHIDVFDVKRRLSSFLNIDRKKIKARIVSVEHHLSHLASSFSVAGFDKAALFSMDALGDFASTMWAIGEENTIRKLKEIDFPHSLGFFYTALTQYLGFLDYGDEYKVMGLAAYGRGTFSDEFKQILKIKKDGFELDLRYFLHHKKRIDMNFKEKEPSIGVLFSAYLEKRLGKRRSPEEPLSERHKDIAFSMQKRLEETLSHLLATVFPKGLDKLCLSGGVSYNCVANGKLFERTPFKHIYVPPAPGDSGLAIGAAFYLWNFVLGKKRDFIMTDACLGPHFSETDIEELLRLKTDELQIKACKIERLRDEELLCKTIAKEIADGRIVGWFQGRMEFGPRALGNRSILADPREEKIKEVLNERVKIREPFRPFAPSILEECAAEYFERSNPSPFMSFVYKIKDEKRKLIPAVSHIDGTGRLQTVNKKANPIYWRLIREFYNITGVPALLNTSFNENEPIVCSPSEAVNCFMRTRMDTLVLGPFIIRKKDEKSAHLALEKAGEIN